MERKARQLLTVLAAMLIAACGVAQEIQFTAAVDRTTIEAGEHVRLQITQTNLRARFNMPDLGGMVILQGPFESSGMQDINGRVSRFAQITWTLTATKPGKYTIGSAQVQAGGKTYQTEPITIEVTRSSAPDPNHPSVLQGQARNANIFVTTTLNPSKVYVGQQVVATYTLYSRIGNLDPVKYDWPELSGVWSEEVEVKEKGWRGQPQVINGVPYYVATLRSQLLLPQKSGKLRIEAASLTFLANRTLFSQGSTVAIQSNPAELTVLPLPSPAPADFNGGVGELQLTVQTDRTDLKANEAAQVHIRISGKGNLKLLEPPVLRLPVGFETYDPKVTDKITVNANGMSGSREFEYLLIPRHEGDHELPAIGFSYFDVKSGAYRQLSEAPITFHVRPGDGGPSATATRPGRTDVQLLENDIRYIRTGDPGLRPAGRLLFGSAPWIAGMAAPALAFMFLLAWRRKRERALADVTGTRQRLADRAARRHLAEAAKLVSASDRGPFYTALSKALQGYMADKFQLGLAQLTQPVVRERLAALPEGEALADRYVALTTACDMARFAPVEETPRQRMYEDAAALIGRIESASRNNPANKA